MEEIECALAVDGVGTVEVFDGGVFADPELVIEAAHFGVLVIDPFIEPDSVAVTAFDHEGAGSDECSHFGIVRVVGEVPLPDLVLADENVAHWHGDGCAFSDPFIEITAADAEAIALEYGRGAHRAFSSVTQAVERDTIWVDCRLG